MIRRLIGHSLRPLVLLAAIVSLTVAAQQCAAPAAEAGPASQQTRAFYRLHLYWADPGNGTIKSVPAAGGTVTTLVNSGLSVVYTMAVSPNGNTLYWADSGNGTIKSVPAAGGTVTTLVNSGLSDVWTMAVSPNGNTLYWADRGNDTIKSVPAAGGTVTTLVNSGLSDVYTMAVSPNGNTLYWADRGNDTIKSVPATGGTVTTLVSSGLSDVYTMAVSPNGNTLYWADLGNDTIKSVPAAGGTVTTLVSSGLSDVYTMAVSPNGNTLYWADLGNDTIKSVPAAGGTVTTLVNSGLSIVFTMAVSPNGNTLYWADRGNDTIKSVPAAGGTVTTLVNSGLINVYTMAVSPRLDTVAASCITDAGTLDADYASHDWEADIDDICPSVFYEFRLLDDTELRISGSSGSIATVASLIDGDFSGDPVASSSTTNGTVAPFIYRAQAGEHVIEVARTSASAIGTFAGKLQTQPMLAGCDVNLGTLSSDQLQVFGGYYADYANCGSTHKYFFYLEYQASVSASISAVGFTPTIKLRPGAVSDSATPTAQSSGNPTNFYQSVASGSYRINLEGINATGAYSLSLQAFGLPPPTRTPIPSPTPRLQTNVDVRIEPNPQGYAYELSHAPYAFALEGNPDSFPALVRSTDEDVRVTETSVASLDCGSSTEAELDGLGPGESFHLHICGSAGSTATLQVVRESDRALLSTYSIRIAGALAPTPAPVPGPADPPPAAVDRLKLGEFIEVVCDAANVGCNVGLLRNGVGALAAGGLFLVPTAVSRGRTSAYSAGIGLALCIIGLILGHLMIGMPLWFAAVPVVCVIFLALALVALKFQRLGS